MKLTTTNKDSNYLAKIVEITNIRKHPNADKLLLVNIDGCDIITSSAGGAKKGDVVCYFPTGSAISAKFLKETNSYRKKELNADQEAPLGFFEKEGRVKPVKLRGIPSDGYIVPINVVAKYSGIEESVFLKNVDLEFDTINHEIFCKKYVVASKKDVGANTQKGKKVVRESRLIDEQFKLHYNTAQLGKSLFLLTPETDVTLTWKLHGTSFVCGNIEVKKKLKWYEKALKAIKINIVDKVYDVIYSSRKVIQNGKFDNAPKQGYYDSDVYGEAYKLVKNLLLKGETIYAEIVGYTPNGSAIQKNYDYGCKPNSPLSFKLYVYRITMTNVDGKVVELSYNQLQERVDQMGLVFAPTIFSGKARYLFNDLDTKDLDIWRQEFFKRLKETYVYDQDSIFCENKVAEEGIVLRIEGLAPKAYKLKAFRFLEHESKEQDEGIVSIEDQE